MLNKKRISRPLFKIGSRVLCLLVLTLAASYSLRTAQSSLRIMCSWDDGDGSITVVSCGSSVGNFMYVCSQQTNQCDTDTYNNPVSDMFANQQCELYEAAGSCDTSIDDGGGIGWLMP